MIASGIFDKFGTGNLSREIASLLDRDQCVGCPVRTTSFSAYSLASFAKTLPTARLWMSMRPTTFLHTRQAQTLNSESDHRTKAAQTKSRNPHCPDHDQPRMVRICELIVSVGLNQALKGRPGQDRSRVSHQG